MRRQGRDRALVRQGIVGLLSAAEVARTSLSIKSHSLHNFL